MKTFEFKLATPENVLVEEDVEMVVVPGIDGNIGVLENHAPTITNLRPGLLTIFKDKKVLSKIFVDGGVAEITPTRCTALVTEGTPIEALDKKSLEIEIKNLMEDVADAQSAEEEKEIGKHLDVAQTKLMETLIHERL